MNPGRGHGWLGRDFNTKQLGRTILMRINGKLLVYATWCSLKSQQLSISEAFSALRKISTRLVFRKLLISTNSSRHHRTAKSSSLYKEALNQSAMRETSLRRRFSPSNRHPSSRLTALSTLVLTAIITLSTTAATQVCTNLWSRGWQRINS
jgi:hypothetical protein